MLRTAPRCVENWRRSSPSSRGCVWLWRSVPSKSCLKWRKPSAAAVEASSFALNELYYAVLFVRRINAQRCFSSLLLSFSVTANFLASKLCRYSFKQFKQVCCSLRSLVTDFSFFKLHFSSFSSILQSFRRPAESGRLLFKPDESDQNPLLGVLFQPPVGRKHPHWSQVSPCST